MKDFENNIKFDSVIDPEVLTADKNSSSVDMTEYRDVGFIVSIGAPGDTFDSTVYAELEVQDSDDNSTFAAVADAYITNSVTGTNTGTFAKVDADGECETKYLTQYRGPKQYVRVVINVTGTHTNGTPYSVVAMRSGLRNLPVTN